MGKEIEGILTQKVGTLTEDFFKCQNLLGLPMGGGDLGIKIDWCISGPATTRTASGG